MPQATASTRYSYDGVAAGPGKRPEHDHSYRARCKCGQRPSSASLSSVAASTGMNIFHTQLLQRDVLWGAERQHCADQANRDVALAQPDLAERSRHVVLVELRGWQIGQLQELAPGRLQGEIERRRHCLVPRTHQQRRRDLRPVLDKGLELVGSEKHPHVIERPLHAHLPQQHRHQTGRGSVGLQNVPAAVGDDGRKRLVPLRQEVDPSPGVGDLGRREVTLAILPCKAAGLEQRIAITQRQVERAGELQKDVAAADGLAGFDKAQMLDGIPASNARSAWLMARRLRQPRKRSPTGLPREVDFEIRRSVRGLCETAMHL